MKLTKSTLLRFPNRLTYLCFLILIFFASNLLNAQVGIGTTTPDASSVLDITASDKGILIPRVSLSNVTNTMIDGVNTAAIGLLIYNTNVSIIGGDGVGFYTFNGTTWEKIITSNSGGSEDADFYEVGTTTAPDAITDDIFTQGQVAIGKTTANHTLDVENNGANRTLNVLKSGNESTPNYGSYITNSTGGTGNNYGTHNYITGASSGGHYGTYNWLDGSTSGTGFYGSYQLINGGGASRHYGNYNELIGSGGADLYGTYSEVSSTNGRGHYGNYNELSGDSGYNLVAGTYNDITNTSTSYQYGSLNSLSGNGNGRHYGIANTLAGSGGGFQYGIYNTLNNSGNNAHTGTTNDMSGGGSGTHIGTLNTFTQGGSGTHIGTQNSMTSFGNGILQATLNTINSGGTGNKYGSYNSITTGSGGTHYGVYSEVLKAGGFAGYFLGNVSIGTTTANNYILPASRGTNSQVMQTDGSGNINWVDASSLGVERINDLIDGRSDNDGTDNGSSLFLGINAGINDDLSNNQNVGVGYQALFNNTYGVRNVANGYSALRSNTVGDQNVANGYNALRSNTNGIQNVANGSFALQDNTNGSSNTATGNFALNSNTSGSYNNAVGAAALSNNTTGIFNTATGDSALTNNSMGDYNTANGAHSLFTNTIGNRNTAIGYNAGYFETGSNTLYIENTDADPNSALIYGEFGGDNTTTGNLLRINGQLQLGTTVANRYFMPTSRGTANQIMQTDGSGNVSWVNDTSLSFWSRTGTEIDVATTGDDIHFTSDQTSIIFPDTSGTPTSMIYMFEGSGNVDRMVFSHSPSYPDWGLEYEDITDSFIFKSATAERVEIDLNGGFPLRVYGTARAVDFESDTTTYPDYVFENYYNDFSKINNEYRFKTLYEIEKFIKQQGHLPGVKSYKEVKAQGMTINLAETSIANLEKIEELFLYTIEQEKEIKMLKSQNKLLEERIEKIETLLQKK